MRAKSPHSLSLDILFVSFDLSRGRLFHGFRSNVLSVYLLVSWQVFVEFSYIFAYHPFDVFFCDCASLLLCKVRVVDKLYGKDQVLGVSAHLSWLTEDHVFSDVGYGLGYHRLDLFGIDVLAVFQYYDVFASAADSDISVFIYAYQISSMEPSVS